MFSKFIPNSRLVLRANRLQSCSKICTPKRLSHLMSGDIIAKTLSPNKYCSKSNGDHRRICTSSICAQVVGDKDFIKITDDEIQYFEKILGSDSVVTDEDILKSHNSDWTHTFHGCSKLMLKPKTSDEVSKILEYCNKKRIAICPQGGNTGLVYGSVPIHDETIVSLSRLDKILSFDEFTGTLVCEAGCILDNLDQHVSKYGYTMPLDLVAKGSCQIGGNISTNAGGLHFVQYGSLHGSVLGLEVVLANGEKLDILSTLPKDNTGYDLKHLFIGAEGTLGIVTKIVIKCPKKPEAKSIAFLGLDSFENVMHTYELVRRHLDEATHAVEFIDAECMNLVEDVVGVKNPISKHPFYMLVEAAGSKNSNIEERLSEMVSVAMQDKFICDGTMTSDPGKMELIWSPRERLILALPSIDRVLAYDLSLPLENFYEPVLEMRKRLGANAQLCFGYGHLGDNNLHLLAIVPEKSREIMELAEPFIYELTSKFRGSISAEHGLGFVKNQHIYYSKSKTAVDYMRLVKKVFDPNGILNPYKTLPPE